MDDRRRDGGTNSTLRTKEQGTHLTLNEHDDDDDDDDEVNGASVAYQFHVSAMLLLLTAENYVVWC